MGYDVERFVHPVNDGLLCCICRDVLEDPLQAPCEHAYCSACIRAWLVNETTCPECRQLLYSAELRSLFRYMKNDLANLQIRCINAGAGCHLVGSLETIDSHESECEFHSIQCPSAGCGQMLERRKLDDHLRECEFSKRTCPKGCGLPLLSEDDTEHNCVAELRMTLELLRSEMICKVEDVRKDADVRLESQKRYMLRRETALVTQIQEVRGEVKVMTEKLEEVTQELQRRQQEMASLREEKAKIVDSVKRLQDDLAEGNIKRICKHCSRQERIKLL